MTPTQRKAMEQALDCLEQLQGGCTDSDDGTVEAITVWCPEIVDALRAALAEQPAERGLIAMKTHGAWDGLESLDSLPDGACLYTAPQPKPAEQSVGHEALVQDAERYRWLRDEAWGGNNRSGPHLVVYRPGLMPSAVTELAEDAADTAIDAAMQEKQS